MTTEHLIISDVCIDFPTPSGPFRALDGVNLTIQQGEFISLIGHSGCGKSTVLNIVAGLNQATRGGVILDGREVDEPGPDRAVVFQNHSLLPWLSAYENVALAVRQIFKGRKSKAEIGDWVRHNLELVHMEHAMDKRPGEISGGMKQRVGIARALAMEPKVLLMDEPFGALDALTRAHMQDSLMEIHARLNNTVIMITHDVDEAVLLSDRIVMMTNGPAASVGEMLAIELLRPRNRLDLADDATYNHYRAEVLRFLHERHGRAEPVAEANKASAAGPVGSVRVPRLVRMGADRRIEKPVLNLGFVPLTDCAPLVIAREKGFFKAHGLEVTLSRESSWSNIRDKVSIGMLDGAQMLAGMPLAAALGSRTHAMVTGLSLDLNGNAITVSNALYQALVATGRADIATPMGSARALKEVIDQRRKAERRPLTFAMVFPESSHNYLLRYWLACAGINPDRDVRLMVVPPQQMVNNLRAGVIAGYCVGEPWNSLALVGELGRTLVTSYDIWNNHPEKVFGVTRAWAEANPNTHDALLRALIEACRWIDQPGNREETCELISHGRFVNAPAGVLRLSMMDAFRQAPDASTQPLRPDFNVFHRYAANFPWVSHALWTLSQMVRWGQVDPATDLHAVASAVYRPALYRRAASTVGVVSPEVDTKVEGEHPERWTLPVAERGLTMGSDLFMDGRLFDPADVAGYLEGFPEVHPRMAATAATGERAA